IGGTAMALAYDARRATRDIDAVLVPHNVVLEEAHALAAELGLPQWWLDEQASIYVAPGGDAEAPLSFDHPGLRVSTASPEHLLAMKTIAARQRDIEDLRILIGMLGLTTAEQVIAVCSRVFPDELLPDRARLALEDLFDANAR
ncbi:MAG TPA: DUF6036 family nucleotidyltransferase, partial [Acidothermaceae bacterium]